MSLSISPDLRQLIHHGAGGLCEYCLTSERLTGYALEIDHIVPQAQGGGSSADNLCLCCRRCNAYKGYRTEALDPLTKQQVALFNPRQDRWVEHFGWNEDGTQIVGQTALGRATIAQLQMNDPLIVRARSLWVRAGWHPPELE
jgi:hypothetical protein